MKTVVVLGANRSGTSMVAAMLAKLGVKLGPPGKEDKEWVYPNRANPEGQYENPEFAAILHRAMNYDGGVATWNTRWDNFELSRRYFDELMFWINHTESELWGWKYTWTLLVIGDLLPLLTNPYFIVMYRDREAVIQSIIMRDGVTREAAALSTDKMFALRDTFVTRHPELKILPIHYEEVRNDPFSVVNQIRKFLDVPVSTTTMKAAANLFMSGPKMAAAKKARARIDLIKMWPRAALMLAQDLHENSPFVWSHLRFKLFGETFRSFLKTIQ
jgi:hypothetical protein